MEPVVVNLTCVLYVHKDDGLIAARCKELGLTAYGYSNEEATQNFKQLFNRCIRTYREQGKLADVLDRSGLQWCWESDYPADAPAYEDTDNSAPAPAAPSAVDPWRIIESAERELALAVPN